MAKRLVVHALKRDYGMKNIVAESPRLKSAKAQADGQVRLLFDFAEEMFALDPAWCYHHDSKRSSELGFELAGADGRFVPARIVNMRKLKDYTEYRGQLDGEGVVLFAPGVEKPVKVRYLHTKPWFGRMTNEAGLPLGAFACDVAAE